MPERIRVQAAPVDFNAKQFLQTDIAEMDVPPKMVQQGKLAWLGRGFEHDGVESERVNKPVCVCGVQVSILIEQSDSLVRFPWLRRRVGRAPASSHSCPWSIHAESVSLVEPSVVFLPKLHLNIEAAALCGGDNLSWIEMADSVKP